MAHRSGVGNSPLLDASSFIPGTSWREYRLLTRPPLAAINREPPKFLKFLDGGYGCAAAKARSFPECRVGREAPTRLSVMKAEQQRHAHQPLAWREPNISNRLASRRAFSGRFILAMSHLSS